MKIVNIMGGLGNQMFEYAFALSLQDRFPDEEVLIDTSHYGRLLPVRKNEIIQTENDFFTHHEEYYQVKGNAYYEGIWESVKNYISIRKKLQKVYAHGTPNDMNAKYIEAMETENSVGIHIRRGDYLKCPDFMGISDLDYYERAIKRFRRMV